MRMRREKFVGWKHKAITLLGMSGVGKTVLANKLPKTQWFHYSGDYRIGTKYLEEPILDNIKRQAMEVPFLRELLRSDSIYIRANITVNNLTALCSFLGKVGDPGKNGLPLVEFKRRQRLHRDAEIHAMRDVESFIVKAHELYGYPHFINDAGGSLCELDDEPTLQSLAKHTLILYLRADHEMEKTLIQRQVEHPKPLYYQEPFLDQELAEYLRVENLGAVEQVDPDRFVRWIFSKLVAHRRPRYQDIADRYGYTVEAREAERVRDEADFIELVGEALDKSRAVA